MREVRASMCKCNKKYKQFKVLPFFVSEYVECNELLRTIIVSIIC